MERKCRTCLESKDINCFHKHNGSYRLDCKICFRKQEKIRRVNRIMKVDEEHANRVIAHQEKIINRGECPIDHAWCFACNSFKNKIEFSPKNLLNYGKCTECSSEYDIQRNRLLKLKAIEYKGGKCLKCGFIGHYSCYDFHHVDPYEKDFDWGKGRKKAFETIKPELDKCVLLCRNCHISLHTKLNNDGSFNSEYVPSNKKNNG